MLILYWLRVTSLPSPSSRAALREQVLLDMCAPRSIGHEWSQLPTSRKWWRGSWFDSGHACFLPTESLQVTSSSLCGDKCLTRKEHVWHTLPNPQIFPCGPVAADSQALTVLSLPASPGYVLGARVAEKENGGLARQLFESLVCPLVASEHLDSPKYQYPDTQSCLETQMTFFSFMMGIVRATFLMISPLVKTLWYLLNKKLWTVHLENGKHPSPLVG